MDSTVNLVQVKACLFDAECCIESEYLRQFHLWQKPLEGTLKELPAPETPDKLVAKLDFCFTEPNVGFDFAVFGESTDDLYSCGMDYQLVEGGPEGVFGKWVDELAAIARSEVARRELVIVDYQAVQFITAWSYRHFTAQDDASWQLIGRLNLDALAVTIDGCAHCPQPSVDSHRMMEAARVAIGMESEEWNSKRRWWRLSCGLEEAVRRLGRIVEPVNV